MRMDGHTALVHTAAASQLGQMLVKICLADNVPLVNIVRKKEQVELLQQLGAEFVVNSSEPTFQDELTAALIATEATCAFDATGGGELASVILKSMERASQQRMANGTLTAEQTRYGSSAFKQVYI